MRMLIDLKNIISRQLPKMPKEYIVKLLFDRNHEAMVIVKNKTKIIGGICFRMFKEQRFTEVVFLAVTATEQVKVPENSIASWLIALFRIKGLWNKIDE